MYTFNILPNNKRQLRMNVIVGNCFGYEIKVNLLYGRHGNRFKPVSCRSVVVLFAKSSQVSQSQTALNELAKRKTEEK